MTSVMLLQLGSAAIARRGQHGGHVCQLCVTIEHCVKDARGRAHPMENHCVLQHFCRPVYIGDRIDDHLWLHCSPPAFAALTTVTLTTPLLVFTQAIVFRPFEEV